MNSTNQKLVKYHILPWNLPFKKNENPVTPNNGGSDFKIGYF